MFLRGFLCAAALTAVSSTALAEGAARFGIGAGKLTIEMDDYDLKGDSTAWEVFGGWEFNQYLAVEVGYMDGGTADDEAAGIRFEADTSAIAASVVASLPIGETFSIFGRAGFVHWESEQRATDGELSASADFDGDDPIFGAGAAVNWEGALVRLEYRIASLDDSDISLISLAMAWRF